MWWGRSESSVTPLLPLCQHFLAPLLTPDASLVHTTLTQAPFTQVKVTNSIIFLKTIDRQVRSAPRLSAPGQSSELASPLSSSDDAREVKVVSAPHHHHHHRRETKTQLHHHFFEVWREFELKKLEPRRLFFTHLDPYIIAKFWISPSWMIFVSFFPSN